MKGFADYIKNQLPFWPTWINSFLLKLNILGPYSYGLAYVKFKKGIKEIDEREKLLEIVRFAIAYVPYYRKKYKDVRINNIDDFKSKIAFIDKDEVMSHWEDFLADGIDIKKMNVCTTGGTSGKALKIVQPRSRYVWELAFMHTIWQSCGWNYNIRAVIRNHHLGGRDYIINPITKEVIFDAFNTSDSYYRLIYEVINKYKISYIHSYPSAAFLFCKKMLSAGLDISFINAFICGSEGITEVQNVFFKKHNIKICTWYGHSEKLILAGKDEKQGFFTPQKGYGFAEIIDDSDTGYGEMVGTTLYNNVFPLIRYKTGDWAYYHNDKNGNIEIEKIIGRWNKSIIYKIDGTYTTITALNLHGDFYDHINGMQYVQEVIGYLKVLIIKNDSFTNSDDLFIREHLAEAMGGVQYVSVKYTNKLIFQANGKFLPLISKVRKTPNDI